MYNVKWDPEINGILLSDDGEIVPPRPVFHEKLWSENETRYIHRK